MSGTIDHHRLRKEENGLRKGKTDLDVTKEIDRPRKAHRYKNFVKISVLSWLNKKSRSLLNGLSSYLKCSSLFNHDDPFRLH